MPVQYSMHVQTEQSSLINTLRLIRASWVIPGTLVTRRIRDERETSGDADEQRGPLA